jgi:hypothetical protein
MRKKSLPLLKSTGLLGSERLHLVCIYATILSQLYLNSVHLPIFFLNLISLSVVEIVWCRMLGLLVNKEWARMWKEAVVA